MKHIFSTAILLSLAACSGGTPPAPDAPEPAFATLRGDAAAGQAAFTQCAACHSMTGGAGIGPSLHGVVGRRAGSLPGFNYSPAMQSSGKTWTPEELYHFLGAPQRAVPGTRMSFAGMRDPQRRVDIIAWLGTQ